MARRRNPKHLDLRAERYNTLGKTIEEADVLFTVNYDNFNNIKEIHLHLRGAKLTKSYVLNAEDAEKLRRFFTMV